MKELRGKKQAWKEVLEQLTDRKAQKSWVFLIQETKHLEGT